MFLSPRRLEDVFKASLQDVSKTSPRLLPDVLRDVFKTSSRRLKKFLQDVFKTSSRHVFKMPSRHLQRNNFSSSKTSSRCLKRCLHDVFKTSQEVFARRLQDVFKTSWNSKNCYTKTCWRRLKDVFKNKKCLLGSLTISYLSIITYQKYAKILVEKASALGRVTPHMSLSKIKILKNVFFSSQFSYCPLIWMCYSRIINKWIGRLQERCLRIIYGDKQSPIEELLEKDNSISIHDRNIQILAAEIYKVSKSISPPQITKLFAQRN